MLPLSQELMRLLGPSSFETALWGTTASSQHLLLHVLQVPGTDLQQQQRVGRLVSLFQPAGSYLQELLLLSSVLLATTQPEEQLHAPAAFGANAVQELVLLKLAPAPSSAYQAHSPRPPLLVPATCLALSRKQRL